MEDGGGGTGSGGGWVGGGGRGGWGGGPRMEGMEEEGEVNSSVQQQCENLKTGKRGFQIKSLRF